ncbi:MAG: hypothetical protein AAFQ44_12640, partial [Pseudomonadota bacterium]
MLFQDLDDLGRNVVHFDLPHSIWYVLTSCTPILMDMYEHPRAAAHANKARGGYSVCRFVSTGPAIAQLAYTETDLNTGATA